MDNYETQIDFSFDRLKENSRISKEALNKLIMGSSQEIIPTEKTESFVNCDSCPYKGLPLEQFKDNCNEFCSFRHVTEIINIPEIGEMTKTIISSITNNETSLKMPYVVYTGENITPSKTAIKQYLLYNFFNVDKYHIIKNISLNDIANLLEVTPSTVKRNNEVLQRINLIHVSYVGFNTYNISIIGRDKLHSTKEENGHGYLTLSKEKLPNLLKIDDINFLRSQLKQILLADMATGFNKDKKIADMSISGLKNVLPFYLTKGRKSIEYLLKQGDSFFQVLNIDFKRNLFEVDITNYETKDMLRTKLEERIGNDLTQFLESKNINLVSEKETVIEDGSRTTAEMIAQLDSQSTKHSLNDLFKSRLADLVGLSIEYGYHTVRNTLLYIQRRYVVGEGVAITNIGGFVRSVITGFINKNGSYFDIAI